MMMFLLVWSTTLYSPESGTMFMSFVSIPMDREECSSKMRSRKARLIDGSLTPLGTVMESTVTCIPEESVTTDF